MELPTTHGLGRSLAPFWKYPPVGCLKTRVSLGKDLGTGRETMGNLSGEGWVPGFPTPTSLLGSRVSILCPLAS